MLAMLESTSSDCARLMRGTASIASAVIGRCASASTSSGLIAGASRATIVAPSFSFAISSTVGPLTRSTTSACHACSAEPTAAPAAAYASSSKLESAPAPASTTTS